MATAKRTSDTKTVTKMVETKIHETVPTITLVLTPDEALTLGLVLSAVGGSPTKSRREHADNVHRALRGAGVDGLKRPEGLREIEGTLFFRQDDRLPDFVSNDPLPVVTGSRVKRVTDEHWFANSDHVKDYGDTECRKGDRGTVTSVYPGERALVKWDKGNGSCIALECLQVIR